MTPRLAAEVRKLAADYASSHAAVASQVADLDERVRGLKREALPAIKREAEKAGRRKQKVLDWVREHRECFAKPKSQVWNGIRFGWRKKAGRVVADDADAAIERIERELADEPGLVKTSKRLQLTGLRRLPAGTLARLGITIEDPVEQPFATLVDDEVERLVDVYLADDAYDADQGA